MRFSLLYRTTTSAPDCFLLLPHRVVKIIGAAGGCLVCSREADTRLFLSLSRSLFLFLTYEKRIFNARRRMRNFGALFDCNESSWVVCCWVLWFRFEFTFFLSLQLFRIKDLVWNEMNNRFFAGSLIN